MNKGLFAAAVLIGAGCAALGVPIDFVLFGLTLVAVALFHHYTLQMALAGLAVITPFAAFMAVLGWHPTDKRGNPIGAAPPALHAARLG